MPDIFDASRRSSQSQAENEPVSTVSSSPESEKVEKTDNSESSAKEDKRCIDDYSEVLRVETPTKNPLNAFAPKPVNVYFDSQHVNEVVVLLLRQHPVTQVRWILIALALILFPLIFTFIPFFDFMPPRYQVAGLIGWYLLVTGFILNSFLIWFFSVYIITDERVIDVDFHNLLHKDVSSAKINNVEDVTSVVGGTLRSIFNYGTVIIQTAGSQQQIEFEDVPQPAKVTKLLNEMLIEEEREEIEGRVS